MPSYTTKSALFSAAFTVLSLVNYAGATTYCNCDSVAVQNEQLTVKYTVVGDPDGYRVDQDGDDKTCAALCDNEPGCNTYDIEDALVEDAYSICYMAELTDKSNDYLEFDAGSFTAAYKGSCETENDFLPKNRCSTFISLGGASQDAAALKRRAEERNGSMRKFGSCDLC